MPLPVPADRRARLPATDPGFARSIWTGLSLQSNVGNSFNVQCFQRFLPTGADAGWSVGSDHPPRQLSVSRCGLMAGLCTNASTAGATGQNAPFSSRYNLWRSSRRWYPRPDSTSLDITG